MGVRPYRSFDWTVTPSAPEMREELSGFGILGFIHDLLRRAVFGDDAVA